MGGITYSALTVLCLEITPDGSAYAENVVVTIRKVIQIKATKPLVKNFDFDITPLAFFPLMFKYCDNYHHNGSLI